MIAPGVADLPADVAELLAGLDNRVLVAAGKWCAEMGAESVDEIKDGFAEDFVEALALKPVKAKQVVKRIEAGMA